MTRSFRILFLSILAMVCLTACETVPTMSLEEAKQVTTSFESPRTLPPRTIDDILVELDHSETEESPMTTLRAQASAAPPVDTNKQELIVFFRNRGYAALATGRTREAIEDYEHALQLGRSFGLKPEAERGLVRALVLSNRDMGRYRQAVALSEELVASTPHNMIYALALISNYTALLVNLGDVGEFERARQVIEKASGYTAGTYDGRGAATWGPIVRMLIPAGQGEIAYLSGDYDVADIQFNKALTIIDRDIAKNPNKDVVNPRGETLGSTQLWWKYRVHGLLAQTLARRGRLSEAEAHARQATVGFANAFGRYSTRTARGVHVLAQVLTEQGRFTDAERLALVVIDIYERMGAGDDALTTALAKRDLADVFVGQRRFNEAAALYEKLEQSMHSDVEIMRFLRTFNLNWALALIEAGQASLAAERLMQVQTYLSERLGSKHYKVAEATGLRACSIASQGAPAEARAGFADAIPILLTRSRAAHAAGNSRSMTDQRLEYLLECYIRSLIEYPGEMTPTEVASETFRLAEHARTRSVQRALSEAAARASLGSPELQDLARREQDAQNRIAALQGLLVQVVTQSGDTRTTIKRLHVKIDRLRDARGALMDEIIDRFPDYAALVNPQVMSIDAVQSVLESGEMLIATYVGFRESYVWAIGEAGDPELVVVPMGRAQFQTKVARLHAALTPEVETLGDIPEFDTMHAYELYAALLGPVENRWREAKRLLIVPHGVLAQLPFTVLVTRPTLQQVEEGALFSRYRTVPWLANEVAISILPSVTSLASLRSTPEGASSRRPFIGFADPIFLPENTVTAQKTEAVNGTVLAPETRSVALRSVFRPRGVRSASLGDLPRLPDTAEEVREIAQTLGADLERDLYLGHRANEQAVKSAPLDNYRVVAFATHGLVPGDLDGLRQPALALAAPGTDGGKDDGLLTMSEVLDLRLDADWVVLSACNTAAAEGEGAEAFSGLGRAFFYAGSRAVLLSNWPVETTSARILTTDLFARQAENPGLRRDEAMRQAMTALIDAPGRIDPSSGLVVYSYAHPIFWAPFTVVGDGR